MHKCKYLALLASLILVGCSSADEPSDSSAKGCIAPMIDVDQSLVMIGRSSAIDTSLFSLTITSSDGRQNWSWASFAEYDPTRQFSVGKYKLAAAYGDIAVEGVDSPFYYGEVETTVAEAATARPQIVCRLANSIIEATVTDSFSNYFTDYKLTLISPRGNQFDMKANSSVYVAPGNGSLMVYVTNGSGVTSDYEYKLPEIAGGHGYKLNIDYNNGKVGSISVSISFNDDTTSSDVNVDLSEELLDGIE